MMCDKDVLHFFEDLNYAKEQLPPFKLSKSVSCSNRHPVPAGCLLSRHLFLDTVNVEDGTDWLSQNIKMELLLYTVYTARSQQVSNNV
jgi:hypothetical protein